jgi:hypothetical protein
MRTIPLIAVSFFAALPLAAQANSDPFPAPLEPTAGVIAVNFSEFAAIPDIDGTPARMMTLFTEPGTERIFVTDMRGPIYSVSYDGSSVTQYVNINDAQWGFVVHAQGRERGMQSMTFHPQFGQVGTPGFGKFYTWTDTSNMEPTADFLPVDGESHHTVLLEWTAQNPSAATYDGAAPRELARFRQPFANHNGGHIAFNVNAAPGDSDYGLLFIGVADGGSGGDPQGMAQNLASGFGKIVRIDPLGNNSANGEYGIPADNPFAGDNNPNTLAEIFAYGVRNPQRFGWDPQTGTMYMTDIGQNTVEKISTLSLGANLGWNIWEGSFRFSSAGGVITENPRSDSNVVYPVAEYDQSDPLISNSAAATGLYIYREGPVVALRNKVLWGDSPSGEIFYFDADNPPMGGSEPVRRILLNDGGTNKTFLQVIQDKNRAQGRDPANRTDMRLNAGPNNRVFLTNKSDGTIREILP